MARCERGVTLPPEWFELTRALEDGEKGRLVDGLMKYSRGDGDWREGMRGNERQVFPALRARLDGRRGEAGRDKGAPRGIEGAIARAWRRAFGGPVKPATARVLAMWARYEGVDREACVEAVVSAAARGAEDPVGDIIAAFKGGTRRAPAGQNPGLLPDLEATR